MVRALHLSSVLVYAQITFGNFYPDLVRVKGVEFIGETDREDGSRGLTSIETCVGRSGLQDSNSVTYSNAPGGGICSFRAAPKNYKLNPNVDSVIRSPPSYQCFANSDYLNSDIFNKAGSLSDCSSACDKDSRCNGFTWVLNENKEFGQCYLKKLQDGQSPIDNLRGAIACTRADLTKNVYVKVNNVDFYNQKDIKTVFNVPSINQCRDECNKNLDCRAVSFTGSTCYLKGYPDNYALNPNVASLVKVPAPYHCFGNSDFFQGDVASSARSLPNCSDACDRDINCNAFTWVLNENNVLGQCYLKNFVSVLSPIFNPRGAIACTKATTPPPPPKKWVQLTGVDLFEQGDIENVKVSSIEACRDECNKNLDCRSVSFTASTCYLKRAPKNYVLKQNVNSVVQVPIGNPGLNCYGNSDFLNSDSENFASSLPDCQKRCTSPCNGFTWVLNENNALGQCYLKRLQAGQNPINNQRGAIACKSTFV